MRKFSSNLDELQEQKLLTIERNGVWFAFWALLVAILVQTTMGIGNMTGEWIVFMALSLYITVACLRKGIWSRTIRPSAKTNLMASSIAGASLGILFFVKSYVQYHALAGSIATAIIMFASTFFLCFLALSLVLFLYQKKLAKLEQDSSEDNEL